MRKIIISILLIFTLLVGGYFFYDFKINKPKKEYYKTLSPKDLDPKSFITLFTERYNKRLTNFVTLGGEFPENWVKPNDIQYLISIMHSKQKCCGYMNIFSSYISNDNAEVGGFAIIFLNSYISQTKINLGLNCNPKTDPDSIKQIEMWYQEQTN
ncbi:hypothetical protein SAMN05444397_102594 [Flavobacterium aquidurense]|uniref:Uncharacterized protein n=1 Tax=Flavobacterium frigidimaris TaxID=262320 RepID=A0ABX4BNL3_FLAFR|nr:hypothetical protein [Flavobacterium frigidimaris]OXA77530.1 hypothetical protein B0A65_15860 [Flavobacterium frigidimaris]SDY90873.1 hypothetical protein SAMN05444397_102594 [Flavobacterium aquidurense]